MAFIDAWLTAYAKIATDEEQRERAPQALADLERSYAAMTTSRQAGVPEPHPRTAADVLAGLLLLRVRRTRAKVLRVFYYLAVIYGLLLNVVFLDAFLRDSVNATGGDGLVYQMSAGWRSSCSTSSQRSCSTQSPSWPITQAAPFG